MQDGKQLGMGIFSFYEEESPIVTEFRRIYSNLKYYNSGVDIKSILITSSSLGEGKSTLASLLATVVSHRHNKKIVLMDCDLRRPNIHRLFGLDQRSGLSELLQGKINLSDCLKKSPLENLKIITSGEKVDNSTELLETSYFKEVLTEVRHCSDLLIADCAPVIPVSDPMIIGPLMDGVILVIKAGFIQKEIVKRATEILNNAQVRLLGVIMNNMKEVLPYYYSYKYYGYEYHSSREKR
ncbi:MAG: CpsD/CapB family tyrosine-protein kinase [candidate division Zixibacteria bacterium]|nr:CpsD/CapB family tyrosine-protein kinase [candidate division Zixibacteria bacterium]